MASITRPLSRVILKIRTFIIGKIGFVTLNVDIGVNRDFCFVIHNNNSLSG